jgi:hypothetical protein
MTKFHCEKNHRCFQGISLPHKVFVNQCESGASYKTADSARSNTEGAWCLTNHEGLTMTEPTVNEQAPLTSAGRTRRHLLVAGASLAAGIAFPSKGATKVNASNKPSIVFCHGI